MTRLRLIGLGGTIAFTDSSTGAVPSLSAGDLPFSPETGDEISSVDVANISSIGVGPAHLVQLVAEIEKARVEAEQKAREIFEASYMSVDGAEIEV